MELHTNTGCIEVEIDPIIFSLGPLAIRWYGLSYVAGFAMFWWLGVGLGLVLPLALGAYTVWRGESSHRKLQISMIGLTSALILVGGFFFRLTMLLGGQCDLPLNLTF